LAGYSIRALVVDDYQPFRQFVCAELRNRLHPQDIEESSDGPNAVQKAEALQPDLILLDIGLPTQNGIEAARLIRRCSPQSKIIFLSENRSSWDIAQEALRTGASGYVVKSDARKELWPAVRSVLQGDTFVSSSLAGP
jgi:DNA-binding NarL/FixJ family response regulator